MTFESREDLEDHALDSLLRNAFPQSIPLPGEFENLVMETINALEREKLRHRKTSRIMAVYWGVTTAIGSGLLTSSTASGQSMASSVAVTLLITTVSCLGIAWFMSRQSGIQLHKMFARTML